MLGALSAGALGITLQRIVDTDSWNSTTTTSDAQVPTSQLVSQGLAFTWDNLLFQAGSHAFAALAWDHNLPVGNASLTTRALDQKESLRRALELYQKDPWLHAKAYKYIAWSAPLQEELLYRVIPSILCSGSGEEWRVGIPSSLVFAAGHNVVSPTAATKHAIPLGAHFKLSLDYVPLPQFFLGAFCWYAARRYGDLTPIVAHMLNNQAGAISLVLAGRASLRRYEQFLQEELSRSES
jgi:membrane protease YdiL (CAAX protease family)